MKAIQLDDDLFTEIDNRTGLGTFTHSEVIRKILHLNSSSPKEPPKTELATVTEQPPKGIGSFLESPEYRMRRKAIEKYLAILAWLHQTRPVEFEKMVEQYDGGTRKYFARSRENVEKSGGGIKAKRIPHSPFWALETLDNRTKRKILANILKSLNFQRSEIENVIRTIPDSVQQDMSEYV